MSQRPKWESYLQKNGKVSLPQWRFERSSRERFYILTAAVVIAGIIFLCKSLFPTSIIGTWTSYSGETVSFDSNGNFEIGNHYGTYTLYEGKKLSITFEDLDYLGFHYSYEWGEKAKSNSNYWYISGNTLYFRGKEYNKKPIIGFYTQYH